MFDSDCYVPDVSSPAINVTEIENGNVYYNSVNHTNRAFSLLHVNARSIKNSDKYNDFASYIESFKGKLDLIVVSETWLSSSDPLSMYSMNGYNSEFWCRNDRQGGGLAVFITEELSYRRIEESKIGNCEEGWLEFTSRSGEKFTLGAIYRPPNNPTRNFIESLERFALEVNRTA